MFENVLGHESIKSDIQKSIQDDTVSHAYVFYGKVGIGKKLFAMEFAKELLQTNNLNSNVDFKYIEKPEDKQNILVEQIREEIIEDIYIAPAMGSYKVYVINDAENMNLAAQNTLLKTLEEPPKGVVIILITNNIDKLIATIQSRANCIYFEKLSDENITIYLKAHNIEVNNDILSFADGSLDVILKMTSEQEMQKYQNIQVVLDAMNKKNTLKLMEILKDFDFKDDLSVEYLEYLLFKNNFYSKIQCVEDSRKAVQLNANEEMQKTSLAIKLVK